MYGMLYGMVWPYLQHENMVWYGSIASLVKTTLNLKVDWPQLDHSNCLGRVHLHTGVINSEKF